MPRYLRPTALDPAVATSSPLPLLPLSRQTKPAKPRSGFWLAARGFGRYLAGQRIEAADLVRIEDLWKIDTRLGIALDAGKRAAAEGQLYTAETVVSQDAIGLSPNKAGRSLPETEPAVFSNNSV